MMNVIFGQHAQQTYMYMFKDILNCNNHDLDLYMTFMPFLRSQCTCTYTCILVLVGQHVLVMHEEITDFISEIHVISIMTG